MSRSQPARFVSPSIPESRPTARPQRTKSVSYRPSQAAWGGSWSRSTRDKGINGSKGREGRPAFDALCKDASRRQFDLIASVVRWTGSARSLQDLVGFLTEIHACPRRQPVPPSAGHRHHHSSRQGPVFKMMGVFAEFERAMIKDRVRAGLERAKAQGKVLGASLNGCREGRGHQG